MTGPITTGEVVLHGRIMPASNATFLGEIGDTKVVYKPVRGERPLWDFPDGTLARRERAAHLVSLALGWDLVPETVLRSGPHGPGMVQRWVDVDEDVVAVDVVRAGAVPGGWLEVFEGVDELDQPVALVHEDTVALRRMAVFDVVVNNADRKGGHVLAVPGGQRQGVDHGICFHVEDKLRTVLWGWAGTPLRPDESRAVQAVAQDASLRSELEDLLAVAEVDRFVARCVRLVETGRMPVPGDGWPSIPWPPY